MNWLGLTVFKSSFTQPIPPKSPNKPFENASPDTWPFVCKGNFRTCLRPKFKTGPAQKAPESGRNSEVPLFGAFMYTVVR